MRGSRGTRTHGNGDDVLDAVAEVVRVLERSAARFGEVTSRAEQLRAGRAVGTRYSELVAGANGPLVVDVVTDLLNGLFAAGSRLRRAETRALYAEGLSMEKISRLLGVSRQRVSALIRSAESEPHAEEPRRGTGLSLTDPELRMVADTLPHLVWLAEADGRTVYVNSAVTAYTGVAGAEAYGEGWLDLVHPDDRTTTRRAWAEATTAGTPFELTYRLRRHDGEYRWHAASARPLRAADGGIAKWIGSSTDVHEHVMGNEALRRAESTTDAARSFVDSLAELLSFAYVVVDTDFRVLRLDRRLAALLGVDPAAAPGHRVADLAPDLWTQVAHVFRRVTATGETVTRSEVVGADGRSVRASFFPVRSGGELTRLAMVVPDLSRPSSRDRLPQRV